MLLGDIIKQYRIDNNLSLQDFANLINTSKSYVHMIEKNLNPTTNKPISPSLDMLKIISNVIHIEIDILLKMLDPEQEISLINNKPKSILVPILGRIPAGTPIEVIEDIIDFEELPLNMVKTGQEYFGLQVKGDSMFPEYKDKDILIVLKQNDCESGDDCIVMVNGDDATFKRVYKSSNGITLQPLNNAYMPLNYTNEDILKLPITILGVVIELRRKRQR